MRVLSLKRGEDTPINLNPNPNPNHKHNYKHNYKHNHNPQGARRGLEEKMHNLLDEVEMIEQKTDLTLTLTVILRWR